MGGSWRRLKALSDDPSQGGIPQKQEFGVQKTNNNETLAARLERNQPPSGVIDSETHPRTGARRGNPQTHQPNVAVTRPRNHEGTPLWARSMSV